MASTYEPIASTTLGSAASSVTLSSISSDYTDLVAVLDFAVTTDTNTFFRVGNSSVSSTGYSQTILLGSGSVASSTRRSSGTAILLFNAANLGASNRNSAVIHIQSYANASVYKTMLLQQASPSAIGVQRDVGLWASTSAIDVITFSSSGNFAAGSTFSLYGIKAA